MWLSHHLDKLGDQTDVDGLVWRVWGALLSEYNSIRRRDVSDGRDSDG